MLALREDYEKWEKKLNMYLIGGIRINYCGVIQLNSI